MKRTEPKSFARIFDENMALAGVTDTFARQRASFVWPEIVGSGINRYTFRRYVTDDGTLHVYITSAALRQELSFHKSTLIDLINKAIGSQAITSIEFH